MSAKKQTLTESKPILSDTSGEIFIPRLKTKINLITDLSLMSFGNLYLQVVVKLPSFLLRHLSLEHLLCLFYALSLFMSFMLITRIIF